MNECMTFLKKYANGFNNTLSAQYHLVQSTSKGYVRKPEVQGRFYLVWWVIRNQNTIISGIGMLTRKLIRCQLNNTRAWNVMNLKPKESARRQNLRTDWKWSDFMACLETSVGSVRYEDLRRGNNSIWWGKPVKRIWYELNYINFLVIKNKRNSKAVWFSLLG